MPLLLLLPRALALPVPLAQGEALPLACLLTLALRLEEREPEGDSVALPLRLDEVLVLGVRVAEGCELPLRDALGDREEDNVPPLAVEVPLPPGGLPLAAGVALPLLLPPAPADALAPRLALTEGLSSSEALLAPLALALALPPCLLPVLDCEGLRVPEGKREPVPVALLHPDTLGLRDADGDCEGNTVALLHALALPLLLLDPVPVSAAVPLLDTLQQAL